MALTRIEGNLGNDPESKTTEKSTFTILSIAENKSKFNKETNSWEKLEPDWFPVLCFGKLGERAMLLKKGDQVCIDSVVSPTTIEVEGKKIKTLNISARKIQKIARLQSSAQEDNIPTFDSNEPIHF